MRLLALAVILALAASQAGVDFSGKWTIDRARSSATGGGRGAGGGAPGGGQGGGLGLGPAPDALVITQSAQTLTIEEHRGGDVSRVIYRLDGKPTTNTIAAGRSTGGISNATSAWQNKRLVTTITYPLSATSKDTVVMEEVRSIDPDGSLVVETTIMGQPNRRRSVYVRPKSAS
jgi:hypothetical protein